MSHNILPLFPDLFQGTDKNPTKRIFLRRIEARFRRECIREDAPDWAAIPRFTQPSQIFEMFKDLQFEAKEHFIVLHLNGKNIFTAMDRVSIGSLNQAVVHPREVFKTALLTSAAAIVLIHNHPSGDPNPSPEDRAITSRLKEAGEIMGIKILDHIVIGNETYLSFVERGLM